jgi:hypothetical protein
MPNSKPIGVAYADPALESGTTLSAAALAENGLFTGENEQVLGGTIATTGNSDTFIVAPVSGVLSSVLFSATDALAANNTNYITFSITNLGQAGAGSTAMLAATAVNTTQVTGGSGISANTRRDLTLAAAANLVVARGDRLRIRAAATGTLANTVTSPVYAFSFAPA